MKTMPLPEIVGSLRSLTGCTEELAERFLTEFETVVTDWLVSDGTAVIEGLGTFRRTASPDGGTSVVFVPDASLAESVNAPFAIFEPIELDDEVTGEMLEEAADTVPHHEPTAQPDDEPTAQPEEEPEVSENTPPRADDTQPEVARETQTSEAIVPETDADETPDVEAKPAEESVPEQEEQGEQPERQEQEQPAATVAPEELAHPKPVTYEKVIEKEKVVNVVDRSSHTLHIVIASILSLAAGVVIGYFTYGKLNISGVKSVNISAEDVQIYRHAKSAEESLADAMEEPADTVAQTPVVPDSVASNPVDNDAQPVQLPTKNTPVTDTVKSNRFLTTMAQEHYGKKKFWVYIYKENEAMLGDPDKIAPNTTVVIPPSEKYGIKPGDKASEAAAERLALEILGKYGRE